MLLDYKSSSDSSDNSSDIEDTSNKTHKNSKRKIVQDKKELDNHLGPSKRCVLDYRPFWFLRTSSST